MDVIGWLTDPARWSGSDSIPVRLYEHVVLAGAPLLVGALIAIPIGLAVGHTGRYRLAVVTIANVGRALPTFALLVIFLPPVLRAGLGLGFWPVFFPLVLLAIPPLLVNAYVAVDQVEHDVREAARAVGMRPLQVLLRVELPLGLPLLFAGLRVAAVQVIATAALGALVASGGLGRYIIDGIARQEAERIIVGAALVAAMALAADALLAIAERRTAPAGRPYHERAVRGELVRGAT
jgi:osmoprotectant transport system permease protein